MMPAIGDHLWQSTLVAVAAAMLAVLVGRRHPGVRFGIWLAASIKFLMPFSMLVYVGNVIGPLIVPAVALPPIPVTLQTISQPFSQTVVAGSGSVLNELWTPALVAVWLLGAVLLLATRTIQWWGVLREERSSRVLEDGREVRAVARLSSCVGLKRSPKVRESAAVREPSLFGMVRPTVLWPTGLASRLNDDEVEAVVAHELCHAKRADNATSALHMAVELLFWFWPVVWWLGAKQLDERERACDQGVLRVEVRAEVYAQALLKVCRFGVRPSSPFTAGVSGSTLRQRVEAIMSYRQESLDAFRRLLTGGATAGLLLGPVVAGVLAAKPGGPTEDAVRTFVEPASITPAAQNGRHELAAAPTPTRSERSRSSTQPHAGPTARHISFVTEPSLTLVPQSPSVVATPELADQRALDAAAIEEFRRGSVPVGSGTTVPVLIEMPNAIYTSQAMRARVQGIVGLEAVILEDGTVGRVRIVNSLDDRYGLDAQAIAAALRWRFQPATRDGVPLAVYVQLVVSFRLS